MTERRFSRALNRLAVARLFELKPEHFGVYSEILNSYRIEEIEDACFHLMKEPTENNRFFPTLPEFVAVLDQARRLKVQQAEPQKYGLLPTGNRNEKIWHDLYELWKHWCPIMPLSDEQRKTFEMSANDIIDSHFKSGCSSE